jgi:UDP-N-acetyl-D-mannosaminuronic acid dehydrogenase
VGAHLSPNPTAVADAVAELIDHFRSGQLVIIRSTVYPGVTAQVERLLAKHGLEVDVAFCPERIAEGKAMTELYSLPQIVGARTPQARRRARELFSHLTESIVDLEPEEAELAKLFTNVWRYIKFAAANQLFMISNDFGLDYERIRQAIIQDYPRAADLPAAGFAAGPCLLKDTMQLADFDDKSFTLGHASMVINEGLPVYVAQRMADRFDLQELTVGILGVAFKGDSDDVRSSLAYKLKRALEFKADRVICTDPFVTSDPTLRPFDEVMDEADLLVIGSPHSQYREIRTHKQIIDVWNVMGEGVLL